LKLFAESVPARPAEGRTGRLNPSWELTCRREDVLIALAMGAEISAINCFLTVRLRINAFIVILDMLIIM
jgi:ABC-type glucose/galactose transport system permease subunit